MTAFRKRQRLLKVTLQPLEIFGIAAVIRVDVAGQLAVGRKNLVGSGRVVKAKSLQAEWRPPAEARRATEIAARRSKHELPPANLPPLVIRLPPPSACLSNR